MLLTRGRREEKIRFVFGLHADLDAATVARKELEALEAALAAADEGVADAACAAAKPRREETLDALFGSSTSGGGRGGSGSEASGSDVDSVADGKIGFEEFRLWLLGGEEPSGCAADDSRLNSLRQEQQQKQQEQLQQQQQQPRALLNSERLCVTRWLLHDHAHVTLSNDDITPTFYQTLAGVTHLEESDIIELEKRYWMLKATSKTGR